MCHKTGCCVRSIVLPGLLMRRSPTRPTVAQLTRLLCLWCSRLESCCRPKIVPSVLLHHPRSPILIWASRIGDAGLAALELCDLDRMWNLCSAWERSCPRRHPDLIEAALTWPADKHGTSASGDFGSLVSRARNCGVLNLAQLDHGQLGGGQPPHLQQHGTEQQQQQQRQQQAKGGFSYFRPSCR